MPLALDDFAGPLTGLPLAKENPKESNANPAQVLEQTVGALEAKKRNPKNEAGAHEPLPGPGIPATMPAELRLMVTSAVQVVGAVETRRSCVNVRRAEIQHFRVFIEQRMDASVVDERTIVDSQDCVPYFDAEILEAHAKNVRSRFVPGRR